MAVSSNCGKRWRNLACLADSQYDEVAGRELAFLIYEISNSPNQKDTKAFIDILEGYNPSNWNKSNENILKIIEEVPNKIQVVKRLIKKIYINQHIPTKKMNKVNLVNILIDALGKRMPKACKLCKVWYSIVNPQNLIRKCAACNIPTHPQCAEVIQDLRKDTRIFCSTCLSWIDNVIKSRLNVQIVEDEEEEEEEEEEEKEEEENGREVNKNEMTEKNKENKEQDKSMDAEILIDTTYEAIKQHTYEEINYDMTTEKQIPKRLYPDLHNDGKEEKIDKKDKICNLLKRGNCRFGERCYYKHPKICQNYEIYGKCAYLDGYGDDCRDLHPKICKNLKEGKGCKFDKKCKYMHPVAMNHNQINNQPSNKIQNKKETNKERNQEYQVKEKSKPPMRYAEVSAKNFKASAPKFYSRDNNCIYYARGYCRNGENCRFRHKMNNYDEGRSNIMEKLDFLMSEFLEMKKRTTYQNRKETWENPYYYQY